MYLDRITSFKTAPLLVARDSHAAAQWELVMAAAGLFGGRASWQSPRLTGRSTWLGDCWQRAGSNGVAAADALLLSPNQTCRLWQRVVDDSAEARELVTSRGPADWARFARRSLFDHGVEPGTLDPAHWHGDGRAFLRWNREFESRLINSGWIDPDSLVYRLASLPPEPSAEDVVLLDPKTPTPAFDRLISNWQSAGFSVDTLRPDGHQAQSTALIASDPAAEIQHAATWAADLLERNPQDRLAIVLPDLDARLAEVEAVLDDRLGGQWRRRRRVGAIGMFGAATNLLRLLSPQGNFSNLSRWLRSPYFGSGDAVLQREKAALELRLRKEARAGHDFLPAYRRYGLRGIISRRLPTLVAELDQAIERLPNRATPTTWTACWQDCLRAVQWQGIDAELEGVLRQSWDSTWGLFSELTPITGALSAAEAFDEFERLLAARTVHEPARRSGVELYGSIDQVGPGFAGAWVSGCTDQRWPEPAERNPLVPWRVRAAHGMPGTDPDKRLELARTGLAYLRQRLDRLVFSCPGRVGDQPQVPSAELGPWQRASEPAGATGYSAGRIGARAWEEIDDPAPPLGESVIPGGARTLDLQAACPVKAFCSARLRAEALEAPLAGLDPRLKGMLVHRVLELIYAPNSTGQPADRLESALEDACASLLGPGDTVWRVLSDAEKTRVRKLIGDFLAAETDRSPFRTTAVERRTEIHIAARQLNCRIDRIDRLETGGELLIDYKTGARPADSWFDARLTACQLPLYAQQPEAEIAGIALIALSSDRISYRSAGLADALPSGSSRCFDAAEWQAQLDAWRKQITALIDEFSRGDVRIPAVAGALARGPYAPLIRVTERMK